MGSLLALPIQKLSEALRSAKRALTDAYAGTLDESGKPISAFDPSRFLFILAEYLGRADATVQKMAREFATQATPFGATGANLDQWLAFKGVTVPTPQAAILTISVTASNNVSLPAGTVWSSDGGLQYTQNAALVFGVPETTQTVQVTAVAIGSLYNLSPGDDIFVQAPPDDLVDPSTVVSVDTTGRDPADDDDKAALLQAAFAADGGAGTIGWYQFQVQSLATVVTQVFVAPIGFGDGTVVMHPLIKPSDATTPAYDILAQLPTQGQVDAWESELRAPESKIVRDTPHVEILPTPGIALTFQIAPDTTDNRAAVVQAVGERFQAEWPTDVQPMAAYSIAVSELQAAAGALDSISSAIVTDVQAGAGATAENVPTPGAPTPTTTVFAKYGQILVGEIAFTP